ncbi:MAG TPA: hypothetical protein VII27_01050 [Thermoplasmata archaeon]
MRARRRSARPVLILLALLAPAVLAAVLSAPTARGAVPHVFEAVDVAFVDGDDTDKVTTLAQSFVATATYNLLAVEALVYDLRTDDTVRLQVVQDAGGLPNGGLVAQAQANGGPAYEWLRFNMTSRPTLVAGVRYWLELISLENHPNGYRWAKVIGGPYTAGWSAYYAGTVWNPDPTIDYLFRTWGIQGPSITVDLSVDSATAGAGDPLRYTVAFDNVGTTSASRVWVNWTPSPDVTYVSDDSAASGGTRTPSGWRFDAVDVGPHAFNINVRANSDVFDGLPITTAVVLAYAEGSVMQETSTDSVTVIARVPSVLVATAASPPVVAPGDNLSYSVTISNVGSRPAGRIWVNDTLPANVTYVADTAAGLPNYTGQWRAGRTVHYNFTDVFAGVYTFTINVTVDPGLRNGTWLVNWVFANYTDARGALREPLSAWAVARLYGASIRVAKSTLSAAVLPRDTVRFTIRFDNLGNAMALNVWINDTLPVGLLRVSDTAAMQPGYVNGSCTGPSCRWEFANVPIGLHAFTVTTQVAGSLADGAVLANVADLSYTDSDGLPLAPSSSTASVRVTRPVFSLSASANQFANPGDTLSYFLRLDNAGSGVGSMAWLNATVPAAVSYQADNASDLGGTRAGPWSWRLPNLPTGAHLLYVAVRLAPGLADATRLASVFTVEYVDAGNNPGAPVSTSVSTTITAPDFNIQAVANRASAAGGDAVTYTILAANTGSGVSADVWINDTIPDGTTFVRSSLQYVSTSGSEYTWHLEDVAPGIVELNVTVRVEGGLGNGAILRNLVSVRYTDANGNFVSGWDGIVAIPISEPILNGGATLPLTILVLAILIAVLLGYIAWKVFGLGSRDKARIDELFLLHRSGELIRHLTRSLRPDIDSDALSGMLVAVQDFIRESFQFAEGRLEELKFGTHKLMLAHGKLLILAAVVAGGRTEKLAPALLSGLHALERDLGPALADWNGMPGDLDGVDAHLDAVLKGKVNGKAPAPPRATA